MNGPPKIDQAAMSRMWLDGVRTGKIAAFFGCKPAAVSACAKRLGLPPRNVVGVMRGAPRPTQLRIVGRPAYLSKPEHDPQPERPVVRHTYATTVQELVDRGMTQRQALQRLHRMRA